MENIVKVFKALGDETRLKILILISSKNICQRGISRHLQISDSAVSQHIKTLKETNILEGYKEGYHVFYKINEKAFEECQIFMKFINNESTYISNIDNIDINKNCCINACKGKSKCCIKKGDLK